MSLTANPMRDQIRVTPPALIGAFDDMERAARLVLSTPEIYRVRHIVMLGSGDSHFAAKAAELALLQHAALPVEVRTPLEAGRYHSQLLASRNRGNTLVIALSNSGGAARVAEAAGLYREAGALVLAVTKTASGRLAGVATKTLLLPVPPLPSAPGYGPYLFATVALLLIGIRIGEVRMTITMDQAQALRADLKRTLAGIETTNANADVQAAEVAPVVVGRPITEYLGAGPDYAVAEYGAAKLLEAVGHHAYARELEEWTHLNYFDGRPEDITTVLAIAPASRAQSRAVELLNYLHKLGRALVIVGGGEAAAVAERLGHRVIAAGGGMPELWSPLGLSGPMASIAAHAAAQTGATYGRGSVGAWSDSADASTVQKSAIWEPAK